MPPRKAKKIAKPALKQARPPVKKPAARKAAATSLAPVPKKAKALKPNKGAKAALAVESPETAQLLQFRSGL